MEVTSRACAARPTNQAALIRRTAAMSTPAQVDVQIKAIYGQIEYAPRRNPRATPSLAQLRFFASDTTTCAPFPAPSAAP